jgi:hypothetical protein
MEKLILILLFIAPLFVGAQVLKQDKIKLERDSVIFDSLRKEFYVKAEIIIKQKKIDSLKKELTNNLYYILKDSLFAGNNNISAPNGGILVYARDCWNALSWYIGDNDISEWVEQYYTNKITYDELYGLFRDKIDIGKMIILSYGYKIK